MKRVILLFVSLAVMAFQLLFAQSFTVKGKVIAEEGNEPLIGVAIMQEGTNNGVIIQKQLKKTAHRIRPKNLQLPRCRQRIPPRMKAQAEC